MKKMKKNFMLGLCAGALSLFCVTGVGMVNANADVSENEGEVSVSSLTMVQSAAAFIGDASAVSTTGGLRFDATLTKEDYQALTNTENYYDVKFGMLVTPSDFITTDVATDLKVGSATIVEYVAGTTYTDTDKVMVNQEIAPMYGTKDYPELYTFRCAVTGIKEYNYSRPFTARAYIATQKTEGAEWKYTYSDSFERAIYSVATYAMNDNLTFSEDTTEQANVESYLNGIIDKVQQYYDISVNVTGATGAEGAANFDDTLTVNGVATKTGDTSKTLDMCPTITVAENTALTAVEKTQNRQYTVTGLGNVAYTWTSGADGATNTESGEATINGKTKLEILTDEASLSNIRMVAGTSTKAQVKYIGDYSYDNGNYTYSDSNVFAWSLKDEYNAMTSDEIANITSGCGQTVATWSLATGLNKYLQANTYIYLDIILGSADVWNTLSNEATGGSSYLYSADNSTSNNYNYYDVNGNAYTSDPNKTVWLRLELSVKGTWDTGVYTGFGVYPGTNSASAQSTLVSFYGKTVYLSDMFLSTEKLTGEDLKPTYTKTLIEKSNTYAPNEVFSASNGYTEYGISFEAVTADDTTSAIVGDRTDVYKWTTSTKDQNAYNRLCVASEKQTELNLMRYFTFDIYLPQVASVQVNWDNGDGKLIPLTSTTQAISDDYVMTLYDSNGQKSTKTFGTNATGAWYTLEVWLRSSETINGNTWGFYITIYQGNKVAYLSNVRISNYSLFGTTVA